MIQRAFFLCNLEWCEQYAVMRELADSHLFGRLNLSFKCLAKERTAPFLPNHL